MGAILPTAVRIKDDIVGSGFHVLHVRDIVDAWAVLRPMAAISKFTISLREFASAFKLDPKGITAAQLYKVFAQGPRQSCSILTTLATLLAMAEGSPRQKASLLIDIFDMSGSGGLDDADLAVMVVCLVEGLRCVATQEKGNPIPTLQAPQVDMIVSSTFDGALDAGGGTVTQRFLVRDLEKLIRPWEGAMAESRRSRTEGNRDAVAPSATIVVASKAHDDAAIGMQRAMRGAIDRRAVGAKRAAKLEQEAAQELASEKMSAAMMGHKTRRDLDRKKADALEDEVARELAASKVQSIARGSRARREVDQRRTAEGLRPIDRSKSKQVTASDEDLKKAKLMEEEAARELAAVSVQKHMRGHLGRKRVEVTKTA